MNLFLNFENSTSSVLLWLVAIVSGMKSDAYGSKKPFEYPINLITDAIRCTLEAYKSNQQILPRETIAFGEVLFVIKIHDSSLHLNNLLYTWEFQNNTKIWQSDEKRATHKFIEEGYFVNRVFIKGYDNDGKTYSGNCYLGFTIKAKLHVDLIAWQENRKSYPRLPSAIESFATGYVYFFVNITDEYNFFKLATYTYTFDFGDSSKEKKLVVNSTRHFYKTVANYLVSVYVNASSTYYNRSLLLAIDYPIHKLSVINGDKIQAGQLTPFEVKCHGSNPVSFCWYVSGTKCNLPSDLMCSPTLISDHCQLSFNHTFQSTGTYCINISATNSIGYANVVHYVQVKSIKKNHSLAALVVCLPIFAILILVTLVCVAMKLSNKKLHRDNSSEEARFDFRVKSSVNESSTWQKIVSSFRTCPKICFWRSCANDISDTSDTESGNENDEHSTLFSTFQEPVTDRRKSRKISYYGTVHMNLSQQHRPIISSDDESDTEADRIEIIRPKRPGIFSKSV